jgi:pimeloyl-ACP methyl ester carboxylesterase
MGSADPHFRDPPAEARWMAQRLHGEVIVVPDADHYPHVEFPEFVNPRLVAFGQHAFAEES